MSGTFNQTLEMSFLMWDYKDLPPKLMELHMHALKKDCAIDVWE